MNSTSDFSRGLAGLRVLSLESRRGAEMAKLIANYGGDAIVAPSMQEVPLESNVEALGFVRTLMAGGFDIVILMTGVGTTMLGRVAETMVSREQFIAALGRVAVVARGPKPGGVLREWGVPVALGVPEPNTWRDLLRALDEKAESLPVEGRRVAVQEYGASNAELLAALAERGAKVTRVPVYQWALPDDTGPLRAAVQAIARREIDVALLTTATQLVHLLRIAAEMNLEPAVRESFKRIAIGSIGPVTTEALEQHGLAPDFEPEHPKMGFLVNAAAQQAAQIVARKRSAGA